MSLRNLLNLRHTLAFRLTLWYASIFTVSTSVAFLFFYLLITAVIRDRTDQELLNQVGQFSTILNLQGIDAVKRVAILEAQAAGVKKIFFRLLYPTGDVFSSSNMSYWQNIGVQLSAIRGLMAGKRHVFETLVIPDRKQKVRILYGIIGPGIILQLGQSMENYTRFIEAFQKIFTTTMALLIVLAAMVGWFMARRALSGVEVISRTARNISGGALEKRVPVKSRGDEVDQLAITFNQMLDRIQTLVTGIKEMSDNIAHDLKSPITRIRGIAEVTLTTGKSMSEYENMAASTIEECDRLLDMINTMLVISKTEAGVNHLEQKLLSIPAVVREACELFQPIAEDKDLRLSCNVSGDGYIGGDEPLIQRMISNLVDNAIKYTPPGGNVSIEVKTDSDQNVVLSVEDTGVGISPHELDQIFDRFYRCDQSRSQPGIGLGLSLARTIARAHGGDIT
ncbi:MAG: HAMP domain-containing protein, partial [Deltaproteobacteria bacterium]|nr:HAMP domain-containing protein [Deltaproteobacteria bacterium]